MSRRNLVGCLLFMLLCGPIFASADEQLPDNSIPLVPGDRILILAPHPDDETLGCGGLIQRAVSLNLPVHIVFLTNGDSNQWSFLLYRKHPVIIPKAVQQMGLIRYREAIAASKMLGVPPDNLTFLGYPDLGTLDIWCRHWNDRPAYRSLFTRVREVPYPNALHPGAPYKGEEILRDVEKILREFHPTKIFVSHPGDYNFDHRAFPLFTQVALWNLESQMQPQVYTYLVHYKNWPRPRGNHPQLPLTPPSTLQDQISWYSDAVGSEAVDRKRHALEVHKSQYNSGPAYLLSFVRRNELFSDFSSIQLRPDAPRTPLSLGEGTYLQEIPEQLTYEQRVAFVGLEWQYVQIDRESLVLSLRFSRPLARGVAASVYVFGYRKDHPFEKMPKLHLRLGVTHYVVYDQDRRLPANLVDVHREHNQIVLRVPLELLGNPQRILTSGHTYLVDVPLDWASWQILELEEPHG